LLEDWQGVFGLLAVRAIKPEHFRPASTERWRAPRGDRCHRRQQGRADIR